ncbi:tripartite tricarboxylate transporter permease [uncultured Dysosmobacter sp.]|uniref:tripartite tricarboxylate transporter permease n=1 Tax=uncultured Dysosmobacter sp. TaxID=2591384 RepID=UPI0026283421|nr:tripartite tricarboxylate transporter permease [uncultured Dysosmobacter sp.]
MLSILSEIINAQNLLMMNVGIFAGIIIGAMPGLSVTFAVTVLLTLSVGLESIPGMYLLLGAYVGGTYGGSITAILINTPGTPNAAATVLDGYPLAKQGRAGDALKAALYGSTIGGLLSAAALIFLAPQLAKIVEVVASPEYFAICLFGLAATISLSKDNIIKGLISAMLGLLFCCVGLDPAFATTRMIFGSRSLVAGFNSVTCMLGLFALSQVLFECNAARKAGDHAGTCGIKLTKSTLKLLDMLKYWKTILKSSIFGIIIGAIPGTGGTVSAMFSYNEARRSSKHPEEFGKGSLEGVLAPETGNNAVTGATMIPMLVLGIPGDAIMAIMLGALTMQGITPGASLFKAGSIWVYAIMGGLILINLFMLLQGSLFIKLFVHVSRIPENILLPCIVTLCMMGAFAINNNLFQNIVLVCFALAGYLMKKFDIPSIPFVIALVLGSLCETNLRRSLTVSHGDPFVFFKRPISCVVLLVSIALLFYPFIEKGIRMLREKRAKENTPK